MAKKSLKITIFHCAFIYSGGGERIVLEQMREFEKRGYEVFCFAPVVDKEKCYPELIGEFNIKPFFIDLPLWVPFRIGLLMILSCVLAPFLAFKFFDSDILIGENQPGTWLAFCTAKVLGKKYLAYLCHPNRMVYSRNLSRKELWKAVPDFFYLSYLLDIFRPLVKFLDSISVRSSEKFLTNGFFIQKEIENIYKKKSIGCPAGARVILKSKLLRIFSKRKKGRLRVNGYLLDKPYLLFIGRHEVWKRIDWMIRMMKRVVKKYPDVRLVIPGVENSYTKRLRRLAVRLGVEERVYFLGKITQEELRLLYFQASVFVFPSSLEDFGIVVLEAASCGVPVVAWNVGGPKDTIVDKKTGFLVRPYSFKQFSTAVVRILKSKSLQKRLGMAGWERVANNFSWSKHGDILEKEIKKMES